MPAGICGNRSAVDHATSCCRRPNAGRREAVRVTKISVRTADADVLKIDDTGRFSEFILSYERVLALVLEAQLFDLKGVPSVKSPEQIDPAAQVEQLVVLEPLELGIRIAFDLHSEKIIRIFA